MMFTVADFMDSPLVADIVALPYVPETDEELDAILTEAERQTGADDVDGLDAAFSRITEDK